MTNKPSFGTNPYGSWKFKPKDKVEVIKSLWEAIPIGSIGIVQEEHHTPYIKFGDMIFPIRQEWLQKVDNKSVMTPLERLGPSCDKSPTGRINVEGPEIQNIKPTSARKDNKSVSSINDSSKELVTNKAREMKEKLKGLIG